MYFKGHELLQLGTSVTSKALQTGRESKDHLLFPYQGYMQSSILYEIKQLQLCPPIKQQSYLIIC